MNQQRKNLKRWFSILLTIIFCFTLMPTAALAKAKVPANTNLWSASKPNSGADKYDSNWIYWSQGASKYGGKMQSSGCRVVAQAKLLMETGIVTDPSFNPDRYVEWGYNNKEFGYKENGTHFTTTITERNGGTAPVKYAKTLGKTLTLEKIVDLSGKNSDDVKTVMGYINQGYYVILGCAAHHVYVHRGMSLQKKTPVIVDSFKGSSYNEAVVVNYDGYHNKSFGCTFTNARLYKVNNPTTGTTTTNTTPAAQTVQIMFNGNGGTVSEKTRTINKGSALGSFPKATRSGYTLKGWYRVNTAVASLKVTETQKINNNMILFAVWTKNTSTATSTTTSAATKTYYVKGTDGTLVMRKGPGSGYAQQTLIPEGAAVKVTPSKNSGSWWYVTYNGKSGYSYSKYLTTTAPKATQLIKDGT
ncbi:MAG: InlB B-repeat-containing protein, partial [Anaerotignum sp.]|nr:InlB B-repeat-containing protein [Anaerotignum sp.]